MSTKPREGQSVSISDQAASTAFTLGLFAQASLHAVDLAQTTHCLNHPPCREANPFLPQSAVGVGALKAAIVPLNLWTLRRWAQATDSHWPTTLLWIENIAMAAIVIRNQVVLTGN